MLILKKCIFLTVCLAFVSNYLKADAVQLFYFQSGESSNKIRISFGTSLEQNVNKFIIERRYTGGNYSVVAIFSGQGNSSSNNNYTLDDHDSIPGCRVYRLSINYFSGDSAILDSVEACLSVYNQCLSASYTLDSNSIDYTILALHGFMGGMPAAIDNRNGWSNRALSFNGIDDFISLERYYVDIDSMDDFSVMFWIKTATNQVNTNSTENVIMSQWKDDLIYNKGYPFHITINNQSSVSPGTVKISRLDYNCNNPTTISSASLVNDNQFHHIAFVKNNSTLSLYIDNILESTTNNLSVCSVSNTDSFYIGKKGGIQSDFFSGTIDDIKIFDCALDTGAINYFFAQRLLSIRTFNITNHFISIFPNPTNTLLNVSITEQSNNDFQFQIVNTLGTTINNGKTTAQEFSIDVSTLPAGIYFLQLQSGSANTVKRFVKE